MLKSHGDEFMVFWTEQSAELKEKVTIMPLLYALDRHVEKQTFKRKRKLELESTQHPTLVLEPCPQ